MPASAPATSKDSALINLLSGGVVVVLGTALMIFGSPARPGERRNALFLALEEMLGYQGACGLLVGIGALLLAVGAVRYWKATR